MATLLLYAVGVYIQWSMFCLVFIEIQWKRALSGINTRVHPRACFLFGLILQWLYYTVVRDYKFVVLRWIGFVYDLAIVCVNGRPRILKCV